MHVYKKILITKTDAKQISNRYDFEEMWEVEDGASHRGPCSKDEQTEHQQTATWH